MIENFVYALKMKVINLLLTICSKLMGEYPKKVANAKKGWQFNNRWVQPIGGEMRKEQTK